MAKNKGIRMDGETEWESSGWGSTKGIEWMGKHKGKQMDSKHKVIEGIAKHKGI